jgi:hypothetical protein
MPGLTTADAARALGVSQNAVRQRIRRGTLVATKVDGVWRIALDVETDHQGAQPSPGNHIAMTAAARRQVAAIRDEFVLPLVERIGELERDLGRVTAERDAEVRRRQATEAERDAAVAQTEELEGWVTSVVARDVPRPADGGYRAPPLKPPAAAPGARGAPLPPPKPFVPAVAAWRAPTTREVDLDAPVPWWKFWRRR